MSGKQIAGIILLLVGLGVSFIGGANVMDLISVGNNPLVRMGLEAQGMSLGGLWMKYGGMTAVGIVMLIVGINFAKKQTVEVSK